MMQFGNIGNAYERQDGLKHIADHGERYKRCNLVASF